MKLFLGLCDGSSFDAHYGMTTEYSKGTEIYFFRGFENSLLQYNDDKSEWKLSLYSKPSIYAIFNGTATYPFGVQKWFVFNDACKYESEDFSLISFVILFFVYNQAEIREILLAHNTLTRKFSAFKYQLDVL